MKTILAIDGGGVRGIMEAIILREVENRIRKKTFSNENNLADYFDVVSGASTGGIISAILTLKDKNGKYKYDCSDAFNFYKDHCYEIFNKSKRIFGGLTYKYCEKALEKYLNKYFGDAELKDLKNHVIIPTVDMNTSKAFFFSNVKSDDKRTDYKVKDVLRCTSAAPTYFKPKKVGNVIGIDGGMVANDTAICCISKLQKYDNTRLEDIYVLNIGSGSVPPKTKDITSTWTILNWATSITNIMLYANVGLVKYQLQQLDLGGLSSIDIPEEFRNYDSDMADASKKNMDKLIHAANKTVQLYTNEIDKIVTFLLSNYLHESNAKMRKK